MKKTPRFNSLTVIIAGLLCGATLALTARAIYRASNFPEARRLFPDYAPCYLEETGDSFDIAINGPGFFAFKHESGAWVFSRESHFVIDDQNRLASPYGLPLEPEIRLATDAVSIRIDARRQVFALNDRGDLIPSRIIQLYQFPSERHYIWGGEHFWYGARTDLTPLEIPSRSDQPVLLQGYRLRNEIPQDAPPGLIVNSPPSETDPTKDEIIQTGKETDFAIVGEGFFAVEIDDALTPISVRGSPIAQGMNRLGFTRYLSLVEKDDLVQRTYPEHVVKIQTQSQPPPSAALTSGLGSAQSPDGQAATLKQVPSTFKNPFSPFTQAQQNVKINPYNSTNMNRTSTFTTTLTIKTVLRSAIRVAKSIEAVKLIEGVASSPPPDDFVAPNLGIAAFDFDLFTPTVDTGTTVHQAGELVKTLDDMKEIRIYRFENPRALQYHRNGVYVATDLSGPPVEIPPEEASGTIRQGYLNNAMLNP
ncbi:MAG: hypothetical protein GC154_04330 [bacterium]|nr:hypothetical protein [bacterium]